MKKPIKKTAKKKPRKAFDPDVMTGEAFRALLEKIYGTPQCQSAFARLIDVRDRTVRSWISGEFQVPKMVALLVNLMIKTKTAPDTLKAS
jgi:DNA-binding transcriptional regulator YiaG